jgi:hypothetical protein
LNVSAPDFINETPLDMEALIYPKTVIVGDIDTPLSSIDRSSRKKSRKPQN